MKWSWEDEYVVSSYEVDARAQMPLAALGKFLQETAYNHANHLGFGYAHLKEKGLFWVLSRLLVVVNRYPGWGERIRVRTWASGVESLFAYRDFQVLDEQDHVIGGAGSAWLVLDAEKRRPQRQELLKKMSHLFPTERAFEQRPAKIPPLSEPEQGPFFPVRYSDLDLYDHVNNAKYIQWILDSYPEQIHRQYEVGVFEINFVSEAKMGDEVAIHTEKPGTPDLAFRHSVKRKVDNRDVCLASAKWRKSNSN